MAFMEMRIEQQNYDGESSRVTTCKPLTLPPRDRQEELCCFMRIIRKLWHDNVVNTNYNPSLLFFKSIHHEYSQRLFSSISFSKLKNATRRKGKNERVSYIHTYICIYAGGSRNRRDTTTITHNQLSRSSEAGGIRHVPAISRPQNERFNLRRWDRKFASLHRLLSHNF